MISAELNGRVGRRREFLTDNLVREALVVAVLAGILAALVVCLGPPGGDFAAHSYQRSLFISHGFSLWNNFWYAGRYSFITYSVLYYPLAALLGVRLLAVLSVAAAAFAFTVVVGRQWGRAARWSSRSFAILWAGAVLTAAFPFILGIAFALLAIRALQTGARRWLAIFAVLALATSPNAFVLLVIVVAGIGLACVEKERTRVWRRLLPPAAVLATCVLAELLLMRIFPGGGSLPFAWGDFLPAVVFCVLGGLLAWRAEEARMLRWIFPVYLAACIALFIIPTGLGHDIARLRFFAFPVGALLVSLRGFRPRFTAVTALVLALAWNVSPLVVNYRQERGVPENDRSYWQPAIGYLHAHLGSSYRVEVVDTVNHWGAIYLPRAGIPITRGWFRQDDYPGNEVLYNTKGLDRHSYLHWLRSLGTRYVVLTKAPTDYSSRSEAALIRNGNSGLRPVFRAPNLSIFEVPAPLSILSGPKGARVLSFAVTQVRLKLAQAGRYRLAVHYSPYWQAKSVCLTTGADGMLRIVAPRGGVITLKFVVNASEALAVLTGDSPRRC